MEAVVGIVFVLFLAGVTVWLFKMWLSAVKCGRQLLAQDQMQSLLNDQPNATDPLADGGTRMYCLINIVFGGLTWLTVGYIAVAGLINCGIYLCS